MTQSICLIITLIILLVIMLTIIENDKRKHIIRLKAESHTFAEIINKIDELNNYIQKSNIKGVLLENALIDLAFWKEVLEYKKEKTK